MFKSKFEIIKKLLGWLFKIFWKDDIMLEQHEQESWDFLVYSCKITVTIIMTVIHQNLTENRLEVWNHLEELKLVYSLSF